MGSDLETQWAAVKAAPLLYLGALIVLSGIIWWFIDMFYRNRIDGLKEDAGREERENARLLQKLDEASRVGPPHQSALPIPVRQEPPPVLVAEPPESITQKPPPEGERVNVPDGVTAIFLRAQYNDKTALEAGRLLAPYIGKWLRVSGKVFEVAHDEPISWSAAIDDDPNDSMATSMLYFEDGEAPKLEMLRRSVNISAVGQIAKVDRRMVRLDHCVLVN